MKSIRVVAAAGVLPILLGCGTHYLSPKNQYDNPQRPQIGSKLVVDKREPVYLVAVDKTECAVSRKRFEKVKLGDVVFCAWQARP